MNEVAIVVPVLNEAKALPALVQTLARLDPAPSEIIVVDGGSSDETVAIARDAGWRVIETARGRPIQINAGVAAASAPLVCVLHADTLPPADMVAVIRDTLADPKTALAGFTPLITGEKTRLGTSLHNYLKTWYAPAIFRPRLFARGLRLLFGDHAMFFRREQFLAVGGMDPGTPVMEEADLCIKLTALGRVRLVPRVVRTSDRRLAEWGALKANYIYLKMGLMWAFGARDRMAEHYPDIR